MQAERVGEEVKGHENGARPWLPRAVPKTWSPRDSPWSACLWNAGLLKGASQCSWAGMLLGPCLPAGGQPHAVSFCRAAICCSSNEWSTSLPPRQNNSFSDVMCIPIDGVFCSFLCVWGVKGLGKRQFVWVSSDWPWLISDGTLVGVVEKAHVVYLLLIEMFNQLCSVLFLLCKYQFFL